MANVNAPHGLKPLGLSLSGGPNFIEEMFKPSAVGTALFLYDAVARIAGGGISAATGNITPGTTKYSGVVLDRGAVSTLTTHKVIVNADAMFEVQSDGVGVVTADLGLNANVGLGAGSATTGLSGHVLTAASIQTTDTLDLHILKFLALIDGSNVSGPYSRVEVVFNKHRMTPVAAGV